MKIKEGKAFAHRTIYIKGDLFQTPYSMVWQLLEKEKFDKKYIIHEPCCGKMAIVDALKQRGYKVTYSDLFYHDNNNFLIDKKERDYIITNPPYGINVDYFIYHAKKVTRYKFAMLLRTNWLSGYGRFKNNIYSGFKNIYIFTRMADLRAPIKENGKYPTAMIVYAWMIWHKGYKGKITIDWINNQKYVNNRKKTLRGIKEDTNA